MKNSAIINVVKSYMINGNPIDNACQILNECSEACVPIYDIFHRHIFRKLDGYKVESLMPIWVKEAGNGEESTCDKQSFEKLCKAYDSVVINQMLYYNDTNLLVAALQDRFGMIGAAMSEFYHNMSYSVVEGDVYTRESATQVRKTPSFSVCCIQFSYICVLQWIL